MTPLQPAPGSGTAASGRLGLLGVCFLAAASCGPSASRQEIVLRFIEEPAEELFDLGQKQPGGRFLVELWRPQGRRSRAPRGGGASRAGQLQPSSCRLSANCPSFARSPSKPRVPGQTPELGGIQTPGTPRYDGIIGSRDHSPYPRGFSPFRTRSSASNDRRRSRSGDAGSRRWAISDDGKSGCA
jgi:hypothetical protein